LMYFGAKKGLSSLPEGIQVDGGRLVINSINQNHVGDWECKTGEIRVPGSSESYSSSAVASLRILQGPTLKIKSSVDKVVRGGNIEFICQLEGSRENSKITWTKEGSNNMPWGCFDDGQGMLIITGVDRQHEGVYSCNAEGLGLTSTVELRLTDKRPSIQYFIRVDQKAVTLTAGTAKRVRCIVETPADTPAPEKLIWSFEGSQTLPSGIVDNGRGTLEITSKATNAASGTYVCSPSSGSGQAKTNVVIRPGTGSGSGSGSGSSSAGSYFAKITRDKEQPKKGESYEFQCTIETPADAPTPRQIVWKKVGSDSLPPEIYNDQRGRLYFYRVDDIHIGTYECSTAYPETDAKASAVLSIDVVTYKISASPATLFLEPGSSGEIICSSEPLSRYLEWLPINKESLPEGVYSRGGRLIIRDARPSHYGLYSCNAGTSGAGEARAEVKVLEPTNEAVVTVNPVKLTIIPGGSGELICTSSDNTKKVEWTVVNKERFPEGVYDDGNGRLIFQNADSRQSGLYSCNAGTLGLVKSELKSKLMKSLILVTLKVLF
jgi:hypothetical protein